MSSEENNNNNDEQDLPLPIQTENTNAPYLPLIIIENYGDPLLLQEIENYNDESYSLPELIELEDDDNEIILQPIEIENNINQIFFNLNEFQERIRGLVETLQEIRELHNAVNDNPDNIINAVNNDNELITDYNIVNETEDNEP